MEIASQKQYDIAASNETLRGGIVISNAGICYAADATLELLQADQWRRRRKAILTKVILAVTLMAAASALLVIRNERKKAGEAAIVDAQQNLEPWQKVREALAKDPIWAELAATQWQAFNLNLKAAEDNFSQIQISPLEAPAREALRQNLAGVMAACTQLLPEVKKALEQKSRESCPKHPNYQRSPEDRACPLPPMLHYQFSVWLQDGRHFWRASDGQIRPFSKEEDQQRCPNR